jgi:hypothetical protein
MIKIHYWADGTWCYEEHLYEYDWMSDDYHTLEVPDTWSDGDVDSFVYKQI